MRKIFNYVIIFLVTAVIFTNCRKMDSNYRKFIVPGSIIYTGKATLPITYPGNNRVRISWLRSTDPSVVKAKIFWNNYIDSVEIDIPANDDTISTIIGNLPEKTYSFFIITFDNDGHHSVPVEVLTAVYGDDYQKSLLNRSIKAAEVDSQNIVTIQWGAAAISNGAYAVDVKYTDTSGKTIVQRFPVEDSASTIEDMEATDTLQYRTVFIPDSLAIDTFYTDFQSYKISRKAYKIDKSNWVATADSYVAPYYTQNVIDNNINTFWNTVYKGNPPPFPHWLEVDMQQSITVVNLELTGRQDYLFGFDFIIQGSDDGINWQNYGSYTLLPQKEPQQYNVMGSPKIRYIRIYQSNPSNPVPQSCFAELTVFGY